MIRVVDITHVAYVPPASKPVSQLIPFQQHDSMDEPPCSEEHRQSSSHRTLQRRCVGHQCVIVAS